MPRDDRQSDGQANEWEVPRVEPSVWIHGVQAPDAGWESIATLERTLLIKLLLYNRVATLEDGSKVLAHDPQTREGQFWPD